jgi:predicted outer membrane repeat protein
MIASLTLFAPSIASATQLVFNSSDALYAAMDSGALNSSSPLVLTLMPGRYLLPRSIVIQSPAIALIGGGGGDNSSWAELACANTSSDGVALTLFSRAVQAMNINLTSCFNTINLTLTRNTFLANPGQGMFVSASSGYVSIDGCVFEGNGRQGVMNQSSSAATIIGISSVSVLSSSFLNNQGPTTLFMSNTSSSSISRSSFISNSVSGNGGAITLLAAGNVSIGPRCLFQSNKANVKGSDGGAIFSMASSIFVSSSEFIQNSAGESGGAIFAGQAQSLNLPLSFVVSDSLFSQQRIAFAMSLPSGGGGAIYLSSISSIAVSGSTFDGNNALFGCRSMVWGGAISSVGPSSAIRITNSTFTNNQACSGGVIFAQKTLGSGLLSLWTIDSVFERNVAQDTGGAIHSTYADEVLIQRCTISNNTAPQGGAVWSTQTTSLVVMGSNFSSNSAQLMAGGIFSSPSRDNPSTINITQSTFRGNIVNSSKSAGGAINLQGPLTASFSFCAFEQNQASSSGGAMFLSSPLSLTLNSCSFQWNQAVIAGGSIYGVQVTLTTSNTTFVSGADASAQGTAVFATNSPLPVSDTLNCSQGGSQPTWITCSGDIAPYPPSPPSPPSSPPPLISPSPQLLPPPPVSAATSSSSSLGLALGLGIGLPCALLSLTLLIFWIRKHWTLSSGPGTKSCESSGHAPSPPPPPDILSVVNLAVRDAPLEASIKEASKWDLLHEVRQVANLVNGGDRGLDDKLVLLETIGEGAHGTVYKGKWRNLDVAVKVRGGLVLHMFLNLLNVVVLHGRQSSYRVRAKQEAEGSTLEPSTRQAFAVRSCTPTSL